MISSIYTTYVPPNITESVPRRCEVAQVAIPRRPTNTNLTAPYNNNIMSLINLPQGIPKSPSPSPAYF